MDTKTNPMESEAAKALILNIAEYKAEEAALATRRKADMVRLITLVGFDKEEGGETLDSEDGFKVEFKQPVSRKVDQKLVLLALDQSPHLKPYFKVEHKVDLKAYRMAEGVDRVMLDRLVTETPGSVAVTIKAVPE